MGRMELDILLNEGIKAATHFLLKSGEFFPFAVVQTGSGEVRHVQALTEDIRPTAREVIDVLTPRLIMNAKSGLYVAVAIVSPVELTDMETGTTSAAIRLDIEGATSDPVCCYLPYELQLGELTVGEIRAAKGNATIFAA
jgi:hypothetical protein